MTPSTLGMTSAEYTQPISQNYDLALMQRLIALGENPDKAMNLARFLVVLQKNLCKIKRTPKAS